MGIFSDEHVMVYLPSAVYVRMQQEAEEKGLMVSTYIRSILMQYYLNQDNERSKVRVKKVRKKDVVK